MSDSPQFTKKDLSRRHFSFHRVKKDSENKSNDEHIDNELTKIYKNNDGSMPDMRNFQRGRKSRLAAAFFTLLFSCLFLAGVAWAGFFVLQPGKNFSEKDVVLSISGDSTASFGQEAKYRIFYRNAQNISLGRAVIQVRYPEGFVFEKSTPEPTTNSHDEWSLGAIDPDGSGYIDVVGKMYGNLGDKQSFRIFLNYTPANFNADFQKVATSDVSLVTTTLSIDILGLDKVAPGKESEITLVAKNSSADAMQNVAVKFDPGSGFTKKSVTPVSDDYNEYQWSFDTLKGEKRVTIKGVFGPGGAGSVKAQIVSWKDSKRQGDGFVLAQKELNLAAIPATPITANLAINASTSDITVEPGESLSVSLVIKNGGTVAIKNVSARVVFDAPFSNKKSLFDWGNIHDALDGNIVGEQLSTVNRRGSIEWDSSKNSAFKQIAVGEQAVIDVQLPLRSAANAELPEFSTYEITATAEVRYELDGKQEIVASIPIKLTVNSDLSIQVRDTKSTENGSSVHTVAWVLNNTFHELKDIRVEADLYGDVAWQKDKLTVPAGTVSYDEKTKKIVWIIPKMPVAVDVLALGWQVLLTENPTQTNLTSKVKVTATDTVTGQMITKVGDEILLAR